MTYSPDTKLYTAEGGRTFSMNDLLNTFTEFGSMRVSDLHLKTGCPPVYRLDGNLTRMKGPDLETPQVEALSLSLLSDDEIAQLHDRRAADGSYFLGELQFRFNCFYDSDGLCLAVRALESDPPPVEQVGFPNNVWRDIVKKQQGLVLVTGITGAGKSTTIASLIDHIARTRPCRIITLEDPIEYRLASRRALISQREVGRDVPSFERGLRDCLREDPDVIFVGEMRDRESASWTLSAAETGHLVFSTLHTRDSRGTITRVLDLFPPNQQDEISSQLSLGLSHVISQKLVPRANGLGRVVAMEILNNTYAISHLIRTRKLEQITTALQTRTKDVSEERMTTFERSLAALVAAGTITPLEAEKWANNAQAFRDELQHVSDGR